ncbi:putative ABC transporter permease, partial [Clostridium butyricum]
MYLFFTFIIYSFAGWIIEELYSKYSTGRFKKDGFLKEPLKPM